MLRTTNLCTRGSSSTVTTRELGLGLVNCESQCINENI